MPSERRTANLLLRTVVRLLAGLMMLLATLAGTALDTPSAAAQATGSSPRSVLIILVDWLGTRATGTPAAPPDQVTPESAEAQVGSTDSAWYQAASYAQFGGWTARAVGWYTIAPPPLDSGPSCGPGFTTNVIARGSSAAIAAGIKPTNYSVVMYYFSSFAPCDYLGATTGNVVLINGSMDTPATVHELGHVLGLGHGHAQTCSDTNNQQVALSGTCQTDEYGDVYSAMGSGAGGNLSAIQKSDLGWMAGRAQAVSRQGGTFTLKALEFMTPGVEALVVPDTGSTLWLEYRQPMGIDSWLSSASTNGVLVHRELPDASRTGSYLLDMTPGSAGGMSDAALPPNTPWDNPLGNLRITVTYAGTTNAVVTFQPILPLVPNVVGQSYTAALSILKASGWAVSTKSVIDPTCNDTGLVVNQSPTAGTPLAKGSYVTIWVLTKPPTPCP